MPTSGRVVFLSDWHCKISIHELFCKFRFLRVLSLSQCSGLTEVPESLGNLKHLHSLDLSSTDIKHLPDSTCLLYNLQTLKLNYCYNLEELPLNLHKLTNLRCLEFVFTKVRKVPIHLGKLKNLQVLSSFYVGKSKESSIQQLGELNLHRKLSIGELQNIVNPSDALAADFKNKTHLVELELNWNWNPNQIPDDPRKDREVLENLQPSKHLEKLSIKNYGGTQFPSWFLNNSLLNVVSLRLDCCKYCLCLPPLGHLPFLKCLLIIGLDGIVNIDANFYGSSSSSFTSLETLHFSNMKEWEEWECKAETSVFPNLQHLSIEQCPKLIGHLPEQLLHLKTLFIHDCNQLVGSAPKAVEICVLDLQDCGKLQFDYHSATLEQLVINGLPSNLNYMHLSNCSKLIASLIGALGANTSLETLHIGKVDVESFPDEGLLPLSLTSLWIYKCPYLKKMNYKDVCHLSSLKELILEDCPNLQCLPEEGLPKFISTLIILGNCPLLKQRCQKPEGAVKSQTCYPAITELQPE
ncbi:hypothetical protein JHK85_037469 [Glycine max]|nr:hypothetical protein JHK85_037469 [Glycine max]